jgi:phosphonatase-like hydrolase
VCLTTGFSSETQQQLIDSLGWRDLVDLVLAPGPGRRGRPFPDLVLQAALATPVDDMADVVVAGDTTSDVESGRRAGAGIVVGVLTGAHGRAELESARPTHVVESVADLPGLLEGGRRAGTVGR